MKTKISQIVKFEIGKHYQGKHFSGLFECVKKTAFRITFRDEAGKNHSTNLWHFAGYEYVIPQRNALPVMTSLNFVD